MQLWCQSSQHDKPRLARPHLLFLGTSFEGINLATTAMKNEENPEALPVVHNSLNILLIQVETDKLQNFPSLYLRDASGFFNRKATSCMTRESGLSDLGSPVKLSSSTSPAHHLGWRRKENHTPHEQTE